jgi:fumarate reductase flavoprotein subunit
MSDRIWDVIVVGGGTAGIPTAIFAARRGAKVLLLEAADQLGGTLHLAQGQLSAAGTKVQKSKGIADTPDEHFDDILRISKDTVDRDLARLAVDNATATFDWLMACGFEMVPEHPVQGRAHEPYSKPRYYWGKDWGRSILKVLLAELAPETARGAVTVRLSTPVESLVLHQGAARGVVVKTSAGDRETIYGRSVVLSSGGYAANPQMFAALNGVPLYGAGAYPFSQGIGVDLAVSAGGYLRGAQNYLSNFGVILEHDRYPSPIFGKANTYPEQRQPWEIYVNVHGRRFVREDEPSVDAREHALLGQPGLRYWIIFDEAIRRAAPPLVNDRSREEVAALFGSHPMFAKADDLEGLARMTGLPHHALAETVAEYNQGQHAGRDSLGRRHMPMPVVQAPFYAIRHQGTSVTSTVGIAINPSMQVIRPDGHAIPGLYAVGELLGSGQLMGNAFCGGMMGTPALTFGRLLGDKFLQWQG